mmetsp:Transcript_12524/g.23505  ORF Transcript_12524/g.23505 Transcript_12524/m.23505 type:complete len:204 (-) Transcript_12524:55-666(-)|eukprot:CAMPEP_0176476928 /NCGR_PEP_ID=MMETSP0200_2-20121128/330_1 /TAXON_ID=947934 /ORGANISM="Chaetoceros sp., Strain GSL56" /LENGTH=203 /DNA_ID=CAMNT_0017872663 /DNA_START=221 /DNA_END=832 /DNA_ORIENTATION=+
MRNKRENTDFVPESSFIQVGRQLVNEDEASKKLLDEMALNLEIKSSSTSRQAGHSQHQGGIIILDENTDKSISISGMSLNSYDVDAVDDMIATIKRKNIFLWTIVIFWLLTVFYFYALLKHARNTQSELQSKIDNLVSEKEQLKFEYVMSRPTSDTMFGFDNCYFNFKASVALGSCAEEITRSAYDWYEWGASLFYPLYEDEL